jgi:hypothetical protein
VPIEPVSLFLELGLLASVAGPDVLMPSSPPESLLLFRHCPSIPASVRSHSRLLIASDMLDIAVCLRRTSSCEVYMSNSPAFLGEVYSFIRHYARDRFDDLQDGAWLK